MIKKALRFLFITLELAFISLLLWCAFNSKLVIYGLQQAKGQLHIVTNTRPIKEILNDPAVSDSVKNKLLYIEEVKQFAIDSLGLKASKNYTTFYDQHGKPLLWVVTAAEKYKLQPYEWKFPLLGRVGYKGFFDKEKGQKLKKELDDLGYDTDIGVVSAWSTLEWFRDPILSNMLRREEGQLAELIIHEMTHATLYVSSDVNFNENLASFVGEEGAVLFLRHKYGNNVSDSAPTTSPVLRYLQEQNDYNLYTQHFLKGTAQLDSLYRTFTDKMPDVEKSAAKTRMIATIVASLDTVSFATASYEHRFDSDHLPNNTYFLSFTRYDAQKDEMRKEMKEHFNGDIKKYLLHLKAKYQ